MRVLTIIAKFDDDTDADEAFVSLMEAMADEDEFPASNTLELDFTEGGEQ